MSEHTDTLFPMAPEETRGPVPKKRSSAKKVAAVAKKKGKEKEKVKKAEAPAASATPANGTEKVARKKVAKKTAKAAAAEPAPKVESKAPVAVSAPPPVAAAPPPAPAPTPVAEPVSRRAEVEAPRQASNAAPAESAPVAPTPQGATSNGEARHEAATGQHQQHQNHHQQHSHQRHPHQQHGHQRHGQPQEGGGQGEGQQRQGFQRFRKWDKRNRFRDRFRDGQQQHREGQQGQQGGAQGDQHGSEGGAPQPAPPPERPLGPPEPSEGILEMTPKGYGFLRQKSRQFEQNPQDPWVSPEFIRNFGLREGVFIKGIERMGHRGPQVTEITEVNGLSPEKVRDLPLFEELKAVNPNKRIQLETRADRLTTRVMDLITPVGRGQRGLIVAPPRAGKTTLLEHIAEAITENHPNMHLILLLVDERPEEVTEFRRTLPNAEIHASSNDSDLKSHIRTATFAIERAKRLVECGQHVFMLLDSITRMGRAFNNAHKGGATMSGGVGVGALEMPRRLFAAARNTRDAGSLTILATTLIETGSRMDDLIFQEFKGTGNLELVLDRKIAEQYVYPAVNILRSGTRREELLLQTFQLEKIHMLRRGLGGHKPIEAIQRVIQLMEKYPSNAQMLVDLPGKAG